MGRRPEQRTVGRAIRVKGHEARINERLFVPGLVGRLAEPEPTGKESQAGRARLEGTHSTNPQQDST